MAMQPLHPTAPPISTTPYDVNAPDHSNHTSRTSSLAGNQRPIRFRPAGRVVASISRCGVACYVEPGVPGDGHPASTPAARVRELRGEGCGRAGRWVDRLGRRAALDSDRPFRRYFRARA